MKVSAAELRDIVEEIVAPYLVMHRGSRDSDEGYLVPQGQMTDEEITDFVLSNPMPDSETAWNLADPGLLGFSANLGETSEEWLKEFKSNVTDWAVTNEWAGGDVVYYHWDALFDLNEVESDL